MVRKWASGLVILAFLLLAAVGWTQEYEFAFTRTTLTGSMDSSTDYDMVTHISVTKPETGFLNSGDYSIIPLETIQGANSSGVQLWMLY